MLVNAFFTLGIQILTFSVFNRIWLSDLPIKDNTLSQDRVSTILNHKWLSDLPLKEETGFWFEAIFLGVRPMPAKTDELMVTLGSNSVNVI